MILLPDQFAPWLQVVSTVILAAILVRLLGAIWATSPALGMLAAVVTLLRVTLGLGLLAVSAWDLPLLRGVHTGDGFWTLSGDSRVYYDLGLTGAYDGLSAIAPGTASPAYTRMLAVWLWGFGPWMFVAIALNTVAYACMMLAVARTCLTGPRQVPLPGVVLSMGALSFSPILMFCSTQILKDVVFTVLLVLFVLTARAWLPRFRALVRDARATPWLFAGLALMMLIIGVIAGIRAYYGVFLIGGLSLPLALWVFRKPLRYALPRAGAALVVGGSLWVAFATGAGAYYEPYGRIVDTVLTRVTLGVGMTTGGDDGRDAGGSEPGVVGALDRARQGFVSSGGNTNIAGPRAGVSARISDEPEDPAANLERSSSRVTSTAVGLAVMFLPLTVLEPLGVVDVSLGRVATLVSDTDTMFILVTMVMLAGFLRSVSGRVSIDWALAACLASVAVVSVVLIGYVVTNVGTLTRLRVPALVFIWLLPLATRVRPLGLGDRT